MVQIVIVISYFILTILIGVFSKKKLKNSSEYDGVGIGLLTCVAVGAGEWLGGTSTTGVSEYGYLYGISGAWYTLANGIGIAFLAIFFAKMFRKMQKPTISGIIGEYIGGRTQLVSSIFQLIIMVAVGISQMIAIGTIGEALFGLNPKISIVVMGIGVLFYTVLGGMNAVGKTNIIHLVTMYGGALVALIICLTKIGGFRILTYNMPDSYFSMKTIGGAKISSWITASLLGGCVAQAGLQPILAAKDTKTAGRASFIIAFIVAPFGFITAILGIISRYLFPGLANAKLALPTLLFSLNPIISGLVMAAVMAAVLSTAAPIFLSCGTLFTKDIYCQINSDRSEKQKLKSSRISTVIFGLVCVMLAFFLHNLQTILDIVYFAYSLRGSLFVILFLGIYWKKVSPLICNIAMGVTSIAGLFWIVFKTIVGHYPIFTWLTETYVTIFLAFVITVIGSCIVHYKAKT